MPELVKLYKNLHDKELQHMLYKTKEGLQKKLLILVGIIFQTMSTNVSLLSITKIQMIILLFVEGITVNIALENNK